MKPSTHVPLPPPPPASAVLQAMLREENNLASRLLTVSEVAHALQVSKSSIYRWVNDNVFPKPITIGHHKRWRPSDVYAYINGEWNATTS